MKHRYRQQVQANFSGDVRAGERETSVSVGQVGKLTNGGTVILEEIRPLVVAALASLVAISILRSRHQAGPVRIPVQFERSAVPQSVSVRRLDNKPSS